MTQRKVVNGYECADGYFNVVISDGSTWWYDWRNDKKWKPGVPSLPPEALGEVDEIKVGDKVTVDATGTICEVQRILDDGCALVTWELIGSRRDWDTFPLAVLTKVPR